MELKVLYKDEHFIVVDKEPDLIINWADPNRSSLHKKLCERFPNDANSSLKYGFYFPHRLDYATSGVMCVGLTKKACAVASSAFRDRHCTKVYIALVKGHVLKDVDEICIPVGIDEKDSTKMRAGGVDCRPATTRMLVLEKGLYASNPATKVLLRPITGRRHQLRVHCHAVGHTIVGDYTYSDRKDNDTPRMFLHSLRLILPNELKSLDISTEDPFQNIKDWCPSQTINNLCIETMTNF